MGGGQGQAVQDIGGLKVFKKGETPHTQPS